MTNIDADPETLKLLLSLVQKPPHDRQRYEVTRVIPYLQQIPILKKKAHQINFYKFVELLGHTYVAKSESVLRFNEIGTTFYILLKGINSAWVPSSQIGVANDLQKFLKGLVSDIESQ